MLISFYFYVGNKRNPPIVDKVCWSLDIRSNQIKSTVYFPKRALNVHSSVNMMGGGGPYKSLDCRGRNKITLEETSGRLACPCWPS